ncbi:MAG: hypothetical protein HY767_01085, partial [Candidatus Omnitrophica bacterium]|nr:hypothetical protein [Candidatus Omnitrophota bacterium]
MISSMLLVWVIAATTAAGCYLLRPWNLEWSNGVQRFVFAAALGLGAWLLTLFWCGWLVSFTPAAAAGVTAFFSVPLALYIAKNLRSINCLKLFFDLGGDVTA